MHNIVQVRTSEVATPKADADAPALPMALVRRFTTSDEDARKVAVYFDSKGVKGSGFGPDIPELLVALADVQKALVRQMPGMDFFISMIPEHYLHASAPHRTEFPEAQCIPAFGQAFASIGQLLANNPDVKHSCDVRVEVKTGREYWGAPKPPRFSLSIIERIPNPSGYGTEARSLDCWTLAGGSAVEFDADSDAAQAILRWYTGSRGGLIQWTWHPEPA